MRMATSAELALVLAFGTTLIAQANGAAPPPAPVVAPAPTGEQIAAAVAFAERQAEQVNGRR